MQLDFQRIKQIPIVQVVNRYRVQLRFSGRSATAICPLPTHKPDDKERTFSIRLDDNYFQCFSSSCRAGQKKGGDVIDFVSIMEHCRPVEAAQKLAEWHGVNCKPPTKAIVNGSSTAEKPIVNHASFKEKAPATGRTGYMTEVDAWWTELRIRHEDEDEVSHSARMLKEVKARLLSSYKAGQSAAR
jgi:DNA primase